ncbi:hypothetical protein ANCDUO_08002 [Ancylostoma duodenale]|uniref:Uncharacterized protein n=1 Tax=Ancylostoma duodenale TaxID=51022 RepID=A0A0C2GRH5_9BILA|nr:hypothetical protein ANCDUO_08002 [Ancylostoma duodenale]
MKLLALFFLCLFTASGATQAMQSRCRLPVDEGRPCGRSSDQDICARECFIEDVMATRTDSKLKNNAGKLVAPLCNKTQTFHAHL